MTHRTLQRLALAATAGMAALALSACGSTPATSGGEENKGTITLGYIGSWTDGRSTAYLLENVLEQHGYTVEHEDISEAGILYTALAKGDVDMYPSAWPEVTHAEYMKAYGDQIEDLGSYYANAKLTWAVPSYSAIQSIEDIPNYADVLDHRIIGIEPSAGLTTVSQDSVIPAYGLDSFTLVTSSTTAMLAELKGATAANEEIVVTLWRPFWANSTFDMRDLTDPKGALGGAEGLHFLATQGFGGDHPEIAEWLGQLKLDDDQYGSLEDLVVNEYGEGKEAEAVSAWLEANPGVLPEWPSA